MDLADDVRLGQREEVVGAAQVARMVGEARTAEVGLAELVALEHRAHGAVEDEDALAQRLGQLLNTGTATRAKAGMFGLDRGARCRDVGHMDLRACGGCSHVRARRACGARLPAGASRRRRRQVDVDTCYSR